MAVRVQLPEKMRFLFKPARYKVAYGGRGSIKSWSFARALLIKAAQSPLRVLCAREFQNSIKESVIQLLAEQISLMGLDDYYKVMATEIRGLVGSEFIFSGIRNNVTKIKSMEGIDICWVEEAEKVSENSWSVLIPTIRKEHSEIWVSFNPAMETDPTHRRFVVNTPPDSVVVTTGWRDNPWLPEVLRMEKDYLAKVDYQAYLHVWEGGLQTKTDEMVLGGKCSLDAFIPGADWHGPFYGVDWGFSSDPATCIKMWIHGAKLFIEEEFWGIGVELDQLPEKFDTVSGARDHTARADNSRPETISYLQRHGYPKIVAASKWPGSVEDGIAFLRSFEQIILHPRCTHTLEESRTYRYKVDKLTGDILPIIIDANNHCWDAVRYALEPLISMHGLSAFEFFKQQYEQKQREKQEGEKQDDDGNGKYGGDIRKFLESHNVRSPVAPVSP